MWTFWRTISSQINIIYLQNGIELIHLMSHMMVNLSCIIRVQLLAKKWIRCVRDNVQEKLQLNLRCVTILFTSSKLNVEIIWLYSLNSAWLAGSRPFAGTFFLKKTISQKSKLMTVRDLPLIIGLNFLSHKKITSKMINFKRPFLSSR